MVDENLALLPTPLRKPPPQRGMACLRHLVHQHSGDIRILVNHVETVTQLAQYAGELVLTALRSPIPPNTKGIVLVVLAVASH